MLINKDTKSAAHSLAPNRVQKFESLCRFLPFRASALFNFKGEIKGKKEDDISHKGFYKSERAKEYTVLFIQILAIRMLGVSRSAASFYHIPPRWP